MKHLMEWLEGFLQKHKRCEVFDKIWENIPPYPGYQPPQKKYRQITMWSGTEMKGVNHVILACFTAAMRQQSVPSLSAAALRDSKVAIKCVRAITDFCLMAQYRSHTPQTIGYMDEYLRDFHKFMYIFGEFRASKADREEAVRAVQELAEEQAQQAAGLELTYKQREKQSAEDQRERQEAIRDIFKNATFNFPKMHLLSHYSSQIEEFGTLPQFSTEITEALHKPLKDAYRRSNRVEAAEQILDITSRDYAIRVRELNLIAWSRDIQLPAEVLKMLDIATADCQNTPKPRRGQSPAFGRPTLGGKQGSNDPTGTALSSLAVLLEKPCLVERFLDYLKLTKLHSDPDPDPEKVSCYRAHYYNTLSVPVVQFQGDEEMIHRVRWTGKQGFRQRGEARADWIWVRRRARGPAELQPGQLGGKMVGRLEGLFSVLDEGHNAHEVALVVMLQLRGSTKPCGEEGMIRVESKGEGEGLLMIHTGDIEGMAHLIPLEAGKVWLVNNRIDFRT